MSDVEEPSNFARFSQTEDIRANLKRKSVRGAAFMASGNAADILVRLLSIAVLARLLSPEDFGLMAMVTALTGIVDGFRDFGLSAATVQRPDITHRQVTNLFWFNVLVGASLALALSATAPLIAAFYQHDQLIGICLLLSAVFVWNGLSVQHEALMMRQLRQGELAAIRLFASVASTLIAIGLAVDGWGYWSLVWREVARSVMLTLGVWLCCRWIPGLPRRNVGTKKLIRFGGELSLTHLLSALIANVDRLLVGRFYGANVVGMYRQAQQLLLAPIEQLNGPIMGIAQPALSALQNDPPRYRRYYEKVVFLVTLGTLPLGLFVAICAEEITLLMLGEAWMDAAVFVQIFGVAAAIRPAIATSAVVLVTTGRSTRFLVLAILHSTVLTLMLLVGLYGGPTGVALAYTGTTFLLMWPKLYYSFQDTPATMGGFFRAIRVPLVAGLGMAAALIAVRRGIDLEGVLAPLIVHAFVGALAYLACIYAQATGRTVLRALIVDVRAALGSKRSAEPEHP